MGADDARKNASMKRYIKAIRAWMAAFLWNKTMLPSPFAAKARAFAIKAHGTQMYGAEPYVTHLDQVVAVLAEFGHTDPQHIMGGYLHDVLEDTPIDPLEIESTFGYTVSSIVQFCTDEKGHTNRKSRKEATYARCQRDIATKWQHTVMQLPSIPYSVHIKLADRIANMRNCMATGNKSLFEMYAKEGRAFRSALYTEASPNSAMFTPMWIEYDRLLAKVLK